MKKKRATAIGDLNERRFELLPWHDSGDFSTSSAMAVQDARST